MKEKRYNILDCAPEHVKLRQVQIDVLKWIQDNINNYDVFVIDAPTATGKSLIAITIANFLEKLEESSSLITPTKLLQDQYTSEFSHIPVLKGQSEYPCEAAGIEGTCKDTKQHLGSCCKPANKEDPPICTYLIARETAMYATTAIFNFHSYYANKMYKYNLIIDEAHNAINFLLEFYSLKLWKCEVEYDDNTELTAAGIKQVVSRTIASLQLYLIDLEDKKGDSKSIEKVENEIERLSYIRDSIERFKDDLLIVKDTGEYYGNIKELRKTKQEYIYVKPIKVDRIGSDFLWPKKTVNKVFALSATINDIDIERLGLNVMRRVGVYKCPNTIPAQRRPFVFSPIGSMKYTNRAVTTPKIIKAIKYLAAHHKGQKGFVHCTYDMSLKIKEQLGADRRFWFHDKYNKKEVYEKFRATKTDAILIACGMDEGVDLAFDVARWQIITQLMRPNVEDKLNSWLYRHNRKVYNWEAVRKIIQQTGRICRSPADFGVTYMLDSEFEEFLANTQDLWPSWFTESMQKFIISDEQ